MSTTLANARRLFLTGYTSLILSFGAPLVAGARAWGASWWMNRSAIVLLAVVNTGLTTSMEAISRGVTSALGSTKEDFDFLIADAEGGRSINRQSLVNIWMTFFASVFGGPVYFFKRRLHRFYFFVAFGGVNSFLAGTIASLLRDHSLTMMPPRILFDLLYCASFKFFSFEFVRTPLLAIRHHAAGVGLLRLLQDFVNTWVRITLLNICGFRG